MMIPLLVLAALMTVCPPCVAGRAPVARVCWRGVDAFAGAKVNNAMSAAVRRPGVVGGVEMPAIFLHPESAGAASIDFGEVGGGLPSAEGMHLFFVTHVGIADGMRWDDAEHPADGARFYVTCSGMQNLASAEVRENRWTPLVARGAKLSWPPGWHNHNTLRLATDCGPDHNANYDWALFGDPMLVLLPNKMIAAGATVTGTSGILVAMVSDARGQLIVEGLDRNGKPVAGAVATTEVRAVPHPAWFNGKYKAEAESTDYTFVRFDFADYPNCVQWRWRADGLRVAAAYGGSWQPRLTLEHCGPAQAVTLVGEHLPVRVAVRNDGMGALLPEAGAFVECDGKRLPVGRIAPGEEKEIEFVLGRQRAAGVVQVGARAGLPGALAPLSEVVTSITILPELPALPRGRPDATEVRKLSEEFVMLQNRRCRCLVYTRAGGLAALLYVWTDSGWERAGAVAPWMEVIASGGKRVRPALTVSEITERSVRFTGDAGHLMFKLRLEVGHWLPALRVDQRLEAATPCGILAFRGPALCVGDRGAKERKGIAIFPGLEYLDGDERSSSERDLAPPLNERWTPHKFKVTVPMMLVETRGGGPVVGIAWNPNQKWDGEHGQPAASFASPNFLEHQANHLMQLSLPSTPNLMPENKRLAGEPVALAPGKVWRLTQFLLAGHPEPDVTKAFDWFDKLVGFPPAEKWPRTFAEEMNLCRHAFLETVWDEKSKKSRHVVGWSPANAPGFAALMLMDARTLARGERKQKLLDRARLIAEQTLAEQGPAGLASSALCHVMGWEFPFHWGRLPAALSGMKLAADRALTSQEPDGGWGYHPGEKQKKLGAPGTRAIGIVARNAYLLAKWVAISGDPTTERALRRALAHMDRYRVPRGAQGWECPILEPDVLAAAYAVRAYTWAYMALGDKRWLDKARYWARTGLPFQYAWDDGQHPGMRYASIPVFGSTYFHHSWIGLPVQWCGLVYAYALNELRRFDDDDLWRRQVEGILASAIHQQWPMDNRELAGSYPDSFGKWFTRRNPVYIGPESIALNILTTHGHDPGLRSCRVRVPGGVVHVTAPANVDAEMNAGALKLACQYAPASTFYCTVAPVAVGADAVIRAGGKELPRKDGLEPGVVGWARNAQLNALVIGMKTDAFGHAQSTVTGIRRALPAASRGQTAWAFEQDVQGWTGAHSCAVRHADGKLVIEVTGYDPFAVSDETIIPAARFKRLRARVRLSGGNQIGLFFRSTVSSGWGPDKEVHVDCAGDNRWREIAFDLSHHPLWSGSILQLRLDIEPPDVPVGTSLQVDWLRWD